MTNLFSQKAEMFANRLRKNYKHFGKWAKRQNISCYRLYNCDLPEFPVIVDCYDGHLYLAEQARRHGLSDTDYMTWCQATQRVCSEVLGVMPEKIFWKKRQRQQGRQQYERLESTQYFFKVAENGLSFWVNLSDYLDTGLFLDHRQTRQIVRQSAAGKRVLNLFAYTGSFSVYAAAGGASSTLTLDLSKTYLNWTAQNLKLNGFSLGKQHHIVQADAKEWLRYPPNGLPPFDLIVLDPPTFSNSKRMKDVLDVQRDHVELINRCLSLTAKGGTIYFSTNYTQFKLQENAINSPYIKEITQQTLPPDFAQSRAHRCFTIGKP